MKHAEKRQFLDTIGSCTEIISIVSFDSKNRNGRVLTLEELMQSMAEEFDIRRMRQEYFDVYEIIGGEESREQLLFVLLIP